MSDVATAGEHALIAATLGYTTVEVVKLWRDAAPSLEDMRAAGPGDAEMAQRVLDANFLGAGLAILLGGTVSYMSRSWVPLILSLGTLAYMAFWYRSVLSSDNWMVHAKA